MNYGKLLDINAIIEDYKVYKSAAYVGRKHNLSGPTVTKILIKAGVEIRHVVKNKTLNLSTIDNERLLELIDGLLLGDACVDKQGCLRIEQSQRRNGWLLKIVGCFENFKINTKISQVKRGGNHIENRIIPIKIYNLLYTSKYIELKEQRFRWYRNGMKKVPRDIKLTPIVLAHWFAGDGTYNKNGTIRFCTNGFLKKDVLFLISELKKNFDIHSNIITERKKQYGIGIYRQKEVLKLKQIMLPHLSECCHYKLQYIKEK